MLTDEGGRRSSSGRNQRGPARPDASRSSSVDRGIEGKEVGEEAQCTGAGKRKTGETRDGVGRRPFMAARRRGREGKGQGVRLGATWGREKERRGRGRGVAPREPARHWCDSSGPLGQRRAHCEQGKRWARATRAQRLTGGIGRQRGPVGSGWVRKGEEARSNADTRAR
jgi:hypothetical protein